MDARLGEDLGTERLDRPPSLLGKTIRLLGRRDLMEALLVALAFLLYFLVRGSVVDRTTEALQRAVDIIRLEQAWGIYWEPGWQSWTLSHPFWVRAFNYIYFWGHFPTIVAFGFWLYFRHRPTYTLLRDALLLSGAIALIIYNLFPVAPPRFMPQWGFVDTMALYSQYSYQAEEMRPFVNPYAAVPSLHFGWVMLLGIGLIWHYRNLSGWALGILVTVAQFFAVVVTGNHFIFDILIGALVCFVGLGLALYLKWVGYPTLVKYLPRRVLAIWSRELAAAQDLRPGRSTGQHLSSSGDR